MIVACKWAREHKIPYLGICLGMQIAVIEWARNVCGIKDANSAELVPGCPSPAVIFMPEISKTHLGGTMRLGLRPTIFEPSTENAKIRRLYGGQGTVWERHRHRYEVNPEMVERFEKADGKKGGLKFIGRDESGQRMQILEIEGQSSFNLRSSSSARLDTDSSRLPTSYRPPVLCRTPGAPRVLLPTAQPVSSVPRFPRRRVRTRVDGRAPPAKREGVPCASPRVVDGHQAGRAGGRGGQGQDRRGRRPGQREGLSLETVRRGETRKRVFSAMLML